MIENARTLIKSILAVLALIPGALTLFGVIALPPSDKEVLRIAVVSASLVSALIVFLSAAAVARARTGTIVVVVIASFLIGVGSLFAWQHYYNSLTYEYSVDGAERRITLPVIAGPLQRQYAQDLGQALESSILGAPLRAEIESRNGSTVLFWSVLLILAQIALTCSVLVGVVRLIRPAGRSG